MRVSKAILWTIFVSCPSIILAGYAAYKTKEILLKNGILINEYIYVSIGFLAMWGAMWLTSNRILKEIFSGNPDSSSDDPKDS